MSSASRTYLKVYGLGLTWMGGAAAVLLFIAGSMGTTWQTMWATAATLAFTTAGIMCIGWAR